MTNTLRITYIVLAHKNPEQTGRLLRRLYYSGARFVLHLDANVSLRPYLRAMGPMPADALRLTRKRVRITWGNFAVSTAMLIGLRDALDWQPEPDFIYYISGQDYPLVSNEHLLNRLATHHDRNFIHHYRPTPGWDKKLFDQLGSYFFRIGNRPPIFYPDPNPQSAKRRIVNQLLQKSGLFPLNQPIPLNYTPYFGSGWMQIKPQTGRYLLSFLEANPTFSRRFRYVLVPEEFFFPTILLNAPNDELRSSIINENLTFVHWDRPAEDYAKPLTVNDFDMLTQSGKLLARKFDQTHDTAIFDLLDQHTSVRVNQ